MKTSIASKLICAAALSLSLTSFAADKKKNHEEAGSANVMFDAAIYKVAETNKVKLSINKSPNARLRILLKDSAGKIYYAETFNEKNDKYRRVFDLEEMKDGKYTFEMYNRKQKLTKEVSIESNFEKLVSLN